MMLVIGVGVVAVATSSHTLGNLVPRLHFPDATADMVAPLSQCSVVSLLSSGRKGETPTLLMPVVNRRKADE